MTVAPISFTDMHLFATIKEEIEDFEEFNYLMRRMDKVYLDFRESQEKTNSNQGK